MSVPPVRGKSSGRIHASACMCLCIYTCVCVYAVGVPAWGLLHGHTPLRCAMAPPHCRGDEAPTSTTAPAGAYLQPYKEQGRWVDGLARYVGGGGGPRDPRRAHSVEGSTGRAKGGRGQGRENED